MKVRSNPKHAPAGVQWPNMPGVYVGAAVAVVEDAEHQDFGKPKIPIEFKFSSEPVDLGALKDLALKDPHAVAYFQKKVQECELLAADQEMADLAGVKFPDLRDQSSATMKTDDKRPAKPATPLAD